MVYPKLGIEGVSVKIDTTSIAEVIKQFDSDFKIKANPVYTRYVYEELGLTFQFATYDKNRVIRSIFIQNPFEAELPNGIRLNESTMKDVLKAYGKTGCFENGDEAWYNQPGITFYIKKDPKRKGYDTKKKIYKIEIHNENEFGFPSQINYEFDKETFQSSVDELISILSDDTIDFKELEAFFQKEREENDAHKPYALDVKVDLDRLLEHDFRQQKIEIDAGRDSYLLNLIRKNDSLVYLILEKTGIQYEVILEKDKTSQYPELQGRNTNFTPYTYGTFCGFIGTPPAKCHRMFELVDVGDYEELADWAHSINPELAVYGYIGLHILKKKGYLVLPKELERMELLGHSEVRLFTCHGCLVGGMEKTKDVLSKKRLRTMISIFEEKYN